MSWNGKGAYKTVFCAFLWEVRQIPDLCISIEDPSSSEAGRTLLGLQLLILSHTYVRRNNRGKGNVMWGPREGGIVLCECGDQGREGLGEGLY